MPFHKLVKFKTNYKGVLLSQLITPTGLISKGPQKLGATDPASLKMDGSVSQEMMTLGLLLV
jgi:hypothetical protein